MEERVFGVADVHEGGFEAGIEVLDAALVDAADHAAVGLALDFELFQHAVHEKRDALFEGFGVDDEFAEGGFLLLEDGEDFLEEGAVFGAGYGVGLEFVAVDGVGFVVLGRTGEFLVIIAGRLGGAGGGI